MWVNWDSERFFSGTWGTRWSTTRTPCSNSGSMKSRSLTGLLLWSKLYFNLTEHDLKESRRTLRQCLSPEWEFSRKGDWAFRVVLLTSGLVQMSPLQFLPYHQIILIRLQNFIHSLNSCAIFNYQKNEWFTGIKNWKNLHPSHYSSACPMHAFTSRQFLDIHAKSTSLWSSL